jgi:hypothetical protein
VRTTLFCYVLNMVGDQWTVMDLQTLGNELWLSLYMVMASPYEIFCSWNVLKIELLKWWCLDDYAGWCSRHKDEFITYWWLISLLPEISHTGCVASIWFQRVYQWIYITTVI